MRWAALLTCATAAALAGVACAAESGAQAMADAAFSDTFAFQAGSPAPWAGPGFATPVSGYSTARYLRGQGLIRSNSGEVASFGRPGVSYFDSVRVATAALDPLPGAALLRPGVGGDTAGRRAFDLTYVRNWPAMFRLTNGRLSFDITPHAGLGVSSGGSQSAEAGALIRLGAQMQNRLLQAIGMTGPGQHPNWYLYAGASGRAVGLNLLRGDDAVRRDDLARDGFMRQAQAGLGMSRGAVHALLGYTHETITMRALGEDSRNDDRVGLTLSIR